MVEHILLEMSDSITHQHRHFSGSPISIVIFQDWLRGSSKTSLADFLPVGFEVLANATLADETLSIPYLGTAVWRSEAEVQHLQNSLFKLPPYTLAGFDLTTHSSRRLGGRRRALFNILGQTKYQGGVK
jgi:hypothetical protein